MRDYTQEEMDDIKERADKAHAFVESLNLGLNVQVYYENIGDDRFVTKVRPFFQDTKYDRNESPKKD